MSRAVERLIAQGHNKHAVLWEYTLDEVELFYELAIMREREQMKQLAIAVRVAFHAKPQAFSSYIQDGDKRLRGRKPSQSEIAMIKRAGKTGKIYE